MKKRLLCLLLALVMVAACLAGCGKKTDEEAVENIEEDASESAATLSMYLLADNLPEDADARKAQIQSVEDAVNRITKAKFKTQIDLRVFATEDEYYAALEAAYTKRIAAGGGASSSTEGDETKEDETYADDLGVVQIKYPDIADYQVDIMYLGGYDKFSEYRTSDWLQVLDSELDTSAKKIKEYVSTPYIQYMKSVNGGTYAIPSNELIGEYTYLLLNKNVLASLDYNTSKGIASIGTNLAGEGFSDYLELVKSRAVDKTLGYAPFVSELTNTELASLCIIDGKNSDKSADVASKLHYFGVNENGEFTSSDFSVFTGTADINAVAGNKNSNAYMSTADAAAASIVNRLSTIMEYRNSDLLVDAEGEKGAAVKLVKGDYAAREAYEAEYEVIVLENPVIETMDLYENMFAVSKYTSSVARSMEIITYLYTNEELHNVLSFGVEGSDYELVDSDNVLDAEGAPLKTVRDLDTSYGISSEKLGNTLIGHYCEDLGDVPAYRKAVMEQNNDAVVDILMGFTYSENNVAPEVVASLAKLSAELKTIIDGFTKDNYGDYRARVTAFYSSNIALLSPINTAIAGAEGEPVSVLLAYRAWADGVGIFVESVATD